MLFNKSPEERLSRSKIQLLMEYPFFGQLAMYLNVEENNSISTAATNGKKYFYNSNFINKLNDKELNFLTAHETLHPALGHLWRCEGKDKVIFNHAADYVINNMILECDKKQNHFQLIKGALYDVKFKDMSTEEVYDILISDENYVKMAHAHAMSGNGGTIDSHDSWGDGNGDESEGSDEGQGGSSGSEEDWKNRVVQAAQNIEGKDKGNIPAIFKRMIKNIISPQKNWRQLLVEFVQQEVLDYGFSPPDKRLYHMDVIIPDWSEPEDTVKNIVFAIDTSGSIDEKTFNAFVSEIIGCMQQFNGKVKGKLIYCDCDIADDGIYDLEDIEYSMPSGGGGSNFNPVFNWISENLDDCVGLVYLTDGDGYYPSKSPNYPVLWLLTSDYVTPFGMNSKIKI